MGKISEAPDNYNQCVSFRAIHGNAYALVFSRFAPVARMNTLTRYSLVAAIMIVAGFGIPTVNLALKHSLRYVIDCFDSRPFSTILIVGNSRTYYNQMPDMVREMADSAQSPVRYAITSYARPGATFESNWNDADVQDLLSQPWNLVVLQAESAAQYDDVMRKSFDTYGVKLANAARAQKSAVAFIVNWAYADSFFASTPSGTRNFLINRIQQDYRALSSETGAKLIDTETVWEDVLSKDRMFPLYMEGDINHPSVLGSYLSALMIYGFVSGKDVAAVTYLPEGVDAKSAQVIKDAAGKLYRHAAN